MTKREAEELIEIEIDGTEKQECTEERYISGVQRLLQALISFTIVFYIKQVRF